MANASRCALAALLLSLSAACGPADPPADGHGPAVTGGYDVTDAGAWQRYRLTQTGQAEATVTFQVVQATATGFTRRSTSSAGAAYTDNAVVADGGGLSLARVDSYDAPGGAASSTFYAPAMLVLPANLADGALTTRTSITTFSGGPNVTSTTRAATVDGLESVTVPAGTYQALKVSTLITPEGGTEPTSSNVAWWAAGLGRVKIVNTLFGTTPTVATFELTASGTGTPP